MTTTSAFIKNSTWHLSFPLRPNFASRLVLSFFVYSFKDADSLEYFFSGDPDFNTTNFRNSFEKLMNFRTGLRHCENFISILKPESIEKRMKNGPHVISWIPMQLDRLSAEGTFVIYANSN